jgi:hypothetical protein
MILRTKLTITSLKAREYLCPICPLQAQASKAQATQVFAYQLHFTSPKFNHCGTKLWVALKPLPSCCPHLPFSHRQATLIPWTLKNYALLIVRDRPPLQSSTAIFSKCGSHQNANCLSQSPANLAIACPLRLLICPQFCRSQFLRQELILSLRLRR